jgi:uncharacterized membrane protein
MKNLKQLFRQPLRAVPSSVVVFMFIVALLGFSDAAYLTVEHYRGVVPPCTLTSDCDLVLTSSYAVIAGIPVALLGTIYYLAILVGLFAYLDTKKTAIIKWTLLGTIFGLLASFGLIYVQVFVLYSYCMYCIGSAIVSTILFITAMEVIEKYRIIDIDDEYYVE